MAYMKKLDSMVRLFDGDLSFTELMSMDLPLQNAIINARLENLRASKDAYAADGTTDAYSKSYIVGGGLFGGGGNMQMPPQEEKPKKEKTIKNARAAGIFTTTGF